jgi:hypothetical protein
LCDQHAVEWIPMMQGQFSNPDGVARVNWQYGNPTALKVPANKFRQRNRNWKPPDLHLDRDLPDTGDA